MRSQALPTMPRVASVEEAIFWSLPDGALHSDHPVNDREGHRYFNFQIADGKTFRWRNVTSRLLSSSYSFSVCQLREMYDKCSAVCVRRVNCIPKRDTYIHNDAALYRISCLALRRSARKESILLHYSAMCHPSTEVIIWVFTVPDKRPLSGGYCFNKRIVRSGSWFCSLPL